MRKRQNKKKDKTTLLFILIGLSLFLILVIKIYFDFIIDKNPNKEISSLNTYGYTLVKSDTKLYKDTYKELENVLKENNIDYKKYATLISKLFIIDVFNLENKITSTDIGGLEFIHKDLRNNFKENLGQTLYSYIESDLNANREQKLPEVTLIETTNIFETKYVYNDIEYESYMIDLSWKYKENLGYQDKIKLTLIKENNKLFIVKGE